MSSILFEIGREITNEVRAGMQAHSDVKDGKEVDRRQDKWGDPLPPKTIYSMVRGVEETLGMGKGKGKSKAENGSIGTEQREADNAQLLAESGGDAQVNSVASVAPATPAAPPSTAPPIPAASSAADGSSHASSSALASPLPALNRPPSYSTVIPPSTGFTSSSDAENEERNKVTTTAPTNSKKLDGNQLRPDDIGPATASTGCQAESSTGSTKDERGADQATTVTTSELLEKEIKRIQLDGIGCPLPRESGVSVEYRPPPPPPPTKADKVKKGLETADEIAADIASGIFLGAVLDGPTQTLVEGLMMIDNDETPQSQKNREGLKAARKAIDKQTPKREELAKKLAAYQERLDGPAGGRSAEKVEKDNKRLKEKMDGVQKDLEKVEGKLEKAEYDIAKFKPRVEEFERQTRDKRAMKVEERLKKEAKKAEKAEKAGNAGENADGAHVEAAKR